MRMLMVRVVTVAVTMLRQLVRMLVLVAFRQMQPHSTAHKGRGQQIVATH